MFKKHEWEMMEEVLDGGAVVFEEPSVFGIDTGKKQVITSKARFYDASTKTVRGSFVEPPNEEESTKYIWQCEERLNQTGK